MVAGVLVMFRSFESEMQRHATWRQMPLRRHPTRKNRKWWLLTSGRPPRSTGQTELIRRSFLPQVRQVTPTMSLYRKSRGTRWRLVRRIRHIRSAYRRAGWDWAHAGRPVLWPIRHLIQYPGPNPLPGTGTPKPAGHRKHMTVRQTFMTSGYRLPMWPPPKTAGSIRPPTAITSINSAIRTYLPSSIISARVETSR